MPEINSAGWMRSLLPGMVSGLLTAIMSVSLAAMIFTGPLEVHLGVGIRLVFTTAIVVGLIMAVFSRCRTVISMVDEDTAPIFALLAASVAASMPAGSSSEQVLFTVLGAILASTVFSGAGLALLGLMRFGAFIQFLPHSVLGGYLAAVGWLLVTGGLAVSAPGFALSPDALADLDLLTQMQLAPALAIALWLVLMQQRLESAWLLPLTILVTLALWHLGLAMVATSPADPTAASFFLGGVASDTAAAFQLVAGLDTSMVDWPAIGANLGSVATIFLISIFSLVLTINGLAHLQQRDTDMNRELLVAGAANMLSGVGGGMTGLPSFSLSVLAAGEGVSRNRYTAIIAVLVCLVIYLFCIDFVRYLPRSILGGILIYLGLNLLKEWLLGGLQKFSPLEYLVIPIIVLVTVSAGFLQGVLVGLVSAIVLFVVKYSRISAIRYVGTGLDFMSNVDRNAPEQECLRESGRKLMIVALQGYLFFGTSGGVYQRIRERIDSSSAAQLRYLVLDFSSVSGLDASAAINFQKIAQLAAHRRFHLLMSGLDTESLARLEAETLERLSGGRFLALPDIDRAVEWCEEDVLASHTDVRSSQGCLEQMAKFLSRRQISTLLHYLEKREVVAGEVLTGQGDKASELYFLETCSASAFLRTSTNQLRRVRRSNRGTVFGELGFYLEIPRTASVVIDTPGLVYVLHRDALKRMEERDPEVAAELNRYMARLVSERLMFTTRTLRAVSA